MLERLHRLFRYDDWANRETLDAMKKTGAPPPRALRYLGHILGAHWLWLERLGQRVVPTHVWPERTLEECEAQLGELRRAWLDYLDQLSETRLSEPIVYRNTKGESWSNSIEDILVHVVMHSAYHRAQIAAEMRAAGHTPAYTDFIQAARQGSLG